jgi:hypothetical protein
VVGGGVLLSAKSDSADFCQGSHSLRVLVHSLDIVSYGIEEARIQYHCQFHVIRFV